MKRWFRGMETDELLALVGVVLCLFLYAAFLWVTVWRHF